MPHFAPSALIPSARCLAFMICAKVAIVSPESPDCTLSPPAARDRPSPQILKNPLKPSCGSLYTQVSVFIGADTPTATYPISGVRHWLGHTHMRVRGLP